MRLSRRHRQQEVELDITSFMNLMIILVPVLLLSMVFARTTIVDLKLPDLAADGGASENYEDMTLEVVLRSDYLDINYPAGTLLKRLPMVENPIAESAVEENVNATVAETSEAVRAHDYETLSLVLQEVKRQLAEKGVEKRDILLLSEPNTSYQALISAMDSIRSYKAVVVADVVDAALFPDISLGDAPPLSLDSAYLPSGAAQIAWSQP